MLGLNPANIKLLNLTFGLNKKNDSTVYTDNKKGLILRLPRGLIRGSSPRQGRSHLPGENNHKKIRNLKQT